MSTTVASTLVQSSLMFDSKATQVEHLSVTQTKGLLLALIANVRLFFISLFHNRSTNGLAYYDTERIAALKSFIVEAPDLFSKLIGNPL